MEKSLRESNTKVEGVEDENDGDSVEEEDDSEEFGGRREAEESKKKIDVMGPVSATADRLGLSVRQRCMMAASVANTLGVNLEDTNINRGSAWQKAKKERLKLAAEINNFEIPERLVVHWDGKILKVKANHHSNRVCVYITGVEESPMRKLLGVPETGDGTGLAEADIVKAMLSQWGVKNEVIAMVFDTTSSNTGADLGACRFLELWLDAPILWLSCRHHVYELHIKWFIQEVMGVTKDPGVPLFRRLKSEWYSLDIDYGNLSKLDLSVLS